MYSNRITPARAEKAVMDSFICAISLLPVFKIYLISLQNICPPKNIKHVSPKYSYPPYLKRLHTMFILSSNRFCENYVSYSIAYSSSVLQINLSGSSGHLSYEERHL